VSAEAGAAAHSAPGATEGLAAVLVVVPARDEERLVGRCLVSLVDAAAVLRRERPGVVARIVVVADACTDRTAELARAFAGVTVIEVDAGAVGTARAEGVRHGLALLADDPFGTAVPERIWLASTDADSAVPTNWLTEQVALADRGVDVMVGTVRPDPADLTPEQDAHWLATHVPGLPNGHVHGANLGVRASSYLEAGGFDGVVEHEDNVLVSRLRTLPTVIVPSDACQVLTSGRLVGRTPGGYAGYLAETL
jgi:hypothetical protein